MPTRRSHRSHATAERPQADRSSPESVATEHNGAAQAAGGAAQQPVMQRAEEAADRLAENIRHYASIVGLQILRFAARVKEEAEDIWAEAQSIRRGGQAPEA
jgi:hypothetical protein